MRQPNTAYNREGNINGIPENILLEIDLLYPGIFQIALNPVPKGMNNKQIQLLHLYLNIKKALANKERIDQKSQRDFRGGNPEYPLSSDLPDEVHEIIFPGSLERRAADYAAKAFQEGGKEIIERQTTTKIFDARRNLEEFFDRVEEELEEQEISGERQSTGEKVQQALGSTAEVSLERAFVQVGFKPGVDMFLFPEKNRTVKETQEFAGRKIEIIGNDDPKNGTEIAVVHFDENSSKVAVNFIGCTKKSARGRNLAKSAAVQEEIRFGFGGKEKANPRQVLGDAVQTLSFLQKKDQPADRLEFSLRSSVIDFSRKEIQTSTLGDMICLVIGKDKKVKRMAKRQVWSAKTERSSLLDKDVEVPQDFKLKTLNTPEIKYTVSALAGKDEKVVPLNENIAFEDGDTIVLTGPELYFSLISSVELESGPITDEIFSANLEKFMAQLPKDKDLATALQERIQQRQIIEGRKPYHLVIINPA